MQQSWYGGRKSGGQEAEFQERIQKEWACLHSGGSFLGFRFHCQCPSIFKVAGPTRKIQSSSKLQQVLRWKAEIPDTPLGLTGIGILEHRWLLHINQFAKKVLIMQYMTYVMTQNMTSRKHMVHVLPVASGWVGPRWPSSVHCHHSSPWEFEISFRAFEAVFVKNHSEGLYTLQFKWWCFSLLAMPWWVLNCKVQTQTW